MTLTFWVLMAFIALGTFGVLANLLLIGAKEKTEQENSRTILLPDCAFCLHVDTPSGEHMLVHKFGGNNYVFLFDTEGDALEYAGEAKQKKGIIARIGRIATKDLYFMKARYKPAGKKHVDVWLNTTPRSAQG